MRWARLGLYTFTGLLTLILVALLILVSVDFGRFKNSLETVVTDLLEREFRIDGELHASLGSTVELYAEDVYLANPAWASEQAFVAAHTFHVVLDAWSLLNGPIEIKLLEVDGLRVNIEKNSAGLASWTFTGLESDLGANDKLAIKSNSAKLAVIAGSLKIIDSAVSYKTPEMAAPLIFISENWFSSIDAESFTIELHGSLNDTPLNFKNKISPVDDFFNLANITAEFSGNIGEIIVSGSAWVDDLRNPKRPLLNLSLEGPSASYLTDIFSLQAITTGPLELAILLEENGEQVNASIGGVFGEFNLDVNGYFKDIQNLNDFALDIIADGPDIGTLAHAAGFEGMPADNFSVKATVETDASGYLVKNIDVAVGDDLFKANGHVGYDLLKGESDFEFDFRGTDIGARVIDFGGSAEKLVKGAYHLTGRIQKEDEKLWLRHIEAEIGDAGEYQFQMSGFLNADQNFVDSEITFHGQGANIAALAELAGQDGLPDSPFIVDTEIRRGVANTYFDSGQFQAGDVVLEFTGYVGDKPLDDNFSLSFDAFVPEVKSLLAEFGLAVDTIPEGTLLVSGSLKQAAGKIVIEKIDASLAEGRLLINGELGSRSSFTGSWFEFGLNGNDLSRILPPDLSQESLLHEFATSGRVMVSDNSIEVEEFQASVGHTTVDGNFKLARSPFADSGSFSVRADSPDIFHLFPKIKKMSTAQQAKLKYRANGSWADNFWYFENSRLELADGYMEINGGLAGPPNFEKTDLNLVWFSPSVNRLSVLVGHELPDQPLNLKGHLVGTRDVMNMNDFELSLGESDLQGKIAIRSGDVPMLEMEIVSNLLDISEYLIAPEDESIDEAEGTLADGKVIPDTALPYQLLNLLDADIDVSIGDMRNGRVDMKDFKLTAIVSDGTLNIENFSYTGRRGGNFAVSAELLPDDLGGADFTLNSNGKGLTLAFRVSTEAELQALPLFDLNAHLTGNGKTMRDFAGNLNGYLRVSGGSGRLPQGSLVFLTQDIVSELVNTINPFSRRDGYINVTCSVVALNFKDGMAVGHPSFVQQTDKLRISANSKINLKTEKLDADFKIVPIEGLGLSISSFFNPYVKLTGSLAKPTLMLNPEGVLIEGGAAVATAGLSILATSLRDRFLSEKDLCGSALTLADKEYNALFEQQ